MWSNKSFLSKYFWSASLYWKLPSQSAVKNLNTVDYLEVLNPLYSKAFILADNYLWHCSWSSATLDRWLSFCFWITHLVNDFQMRRVNAAMRVKRMIERPKFYSWSLLFKLHLHEFVSEKPKRHIFNVSSSFMNYSY